MEIMKTNKKLDKFFKSHIKWVLGYRKVATHLITVGNRKEWKDIVELNDSIQKPHRCNVITEAFRWALEHNPPQIEAKEPNE